MRILGIGSRRGQVSLGALTSLFASAIGAIMIQVAAPGGSIAVMLGAATAIVGIYGFLLLAYRDLLKGLARLEGEPDIRAASIALLREDLGRTLAEIRRDVVGLEDRERARLERARLDRLEHGEP